jgi:1-deoxy-D-xylulose-5-phosphate reductoisomerase
MKTLALIGSTGSVGKSTLDVVARHPDRFRVVALGGGANLEELARQAEAFRPELVSSTDPGAPAFLRGRLGAACPEIVVGEEGAVLVAAHAGAQVLVSAIVGAAGMVPTFAAVSAGKTVALANKESLVAAGELMMSRARATGAALLPVDSEHNALHQCLRGSEGRDVRRLILTASGGPFRGRSRAQLQSVTPAEALRHPTWTMGPKITIDSATLMNKGLEVIEARWLFDVPGERIEVLVHPQSTVHSLVEFVDGSMLAQLGVTDMRHPIQYALTYPERWESSLAPLDLAVAGKLEFERPDRETFPCLELGYRALAAGGTAPAVLNAANEVAVKYFLEGRLTFHDIPAVIEETLSRHAGPPARSIEDVLDVDREARRAAAVSAQRLSSVSR